MKRLSAVSILLLRYEWCFDGEEVRLNSGIHDMDGDWSESALCRIFSRPMGGCGEDDEDSTYYIHNNNIQTTICMHSLLLGYIRYIRAYVAARDKDLFSGEAGDDALGYIDAHWMHIELWITPIPSPDSFISYSYDCMGSVVVRASTIAIIPSNSSPVPSPPSLESRPMMYQPKQPHCHPSLWTRSIG